MNKDTLQVALYDYIQDTENPELNYRLARVYYSMGHLAAALSFFLRTAERTSDKDLSYECLLMIGHCFDRPKNRSNSVRGSFKQAMMLDPSRPEAYFLLARHYERANDHVSGYTFAELGLTHANIKSKPLRGDVEYPGEYGLTFQKAVSAWWWGREMESRKLFRYLSDEYHNKMDEPHTNAVYNNLVNLGIGRESVTHKKYDKSKHSKLRFKFAGSEYIEQTHAQVYQDLFVLSCLNGKRAGTYLEIGSAGPWYGNNTALLELDFGWKGVGIDYDEKFVNEYRAARKNPVLFQNALEVDYNKLLSDLAVNDVVDYLQLDCEPSKVTYDIMMRIPFDKYKFAVITYEHDHYLDRTKSYRTKSREFLLSKGYELVVSDVSPEGGSSFEDWYVHPDLVDRSIIDIMKDTTNQVKNIDDYMFPPHQEIAIKTHQIRRKNGKKEYWRSTQYPTLEITTNIAEKGCVVDCAFCPQRILEKSYVSSTRIMTLDDFKFMIDKVPQEVRITFAGFTEPWLNKYATDMALYAHQKGHPISAFTTAVGMTPDDVERLKEIPFAGNPNGGFCLHLPDQERIAKHPINDNYIRTIETFKKNEHLFKNFYTMCMSHTVHESVRHLYPVAHVPEFWNRAGNLLGEAVLKPELDKLKFRSAPVAEDSRTCGCVEGLYHNVLLPNGDVSLCCMDYSLDYILGNLYNRDYDDILPAPNTTFNMCRKCENGVPIHVPVEF